MTGDEKKKRDPIFSTCFVIFILAAVGVVGVFVDEHYLTDDDRKVAYGDSITVNYVGTFYDYYGEKNAVVFDTNISSVGKNDSVIKSNSFNSTSFSSYSVTVGSKGSLDAFENALVGHKIGDKVKVEIENGYDSGSVITDASTNGITVPVVQEMTLAQYKEVYGSSPTVSGSAITTAYGWPAIAVLDSTAQKVVITNMPESGKTYDYTVDDSDDKHSFGTVKFAVTGVNSGTITYNMSIEGYTTVDSSTGEIQMVQLELGDKTMYVTHYNGSSFTYKTCDETKNQTLYFEIEILSIS